MFDNLEKWINKVIYISNGVCTEKENLTTFNKRGNLFDSVKEVISNDYNKNTDYMYSINPLKYGPQFGYGSGKSNLIKNIKLIRYFEILYILGFIYKEYPEIN